MRVAVIGGTGHIGTYLCPQLIQAGYEVVCVSRGQRRPYTEDPAWEPVAFAVLDRSVEEAAGTFGERIAALHADVVIDITCFTLESARQMVDALRGKVQHLLHCGTIWVHGHSVQVPTLEEAPREPFGEYGCRKAAIEAFLLQAKGFPVTILHPGHLVGTGWAPINPAGNFNLQVFSDLAAGREVLLPHLGMETLHHVHARDVAQAFVLAIAHPHAAISQSFHVVSPAALTLRGYAEAMSAWFGRPPKLRLVPWEEWRASASEKDAQITWNHLAHSSNCSIEKARSRIGYAPRYTSLQAVQEAVRWLMEKQSIS
jgi:nucleoside-diphosphate-sugar epimerase